MSLRKLLAVRFAVLLILIAASVIIINFTTFIEEAQRMGYTVLSLAVIVAMGAASTYMSLSKMKPETMTNGGVPERSDPEQTPIQTTSDEVEENMRKMLQQNPDIIPPQKTDLAPRNPQTVNNEGKQVILDKIVDALRNADVKVSVDGTVDTEGKMDIGKFEFEISSTKTGTAPPAKEEPKKPERKLSNQGRQA